MQQKKRKNIFISVIALGVILILGFFSFGGRQLFAKKATTPTVKIGVMAGTKKEDEVWHLVQQIAKQKYHVNIELVKFTDYSQPNKALTDGAIDLNAYQHYAGLTAWNKVYHSDIVAIGDTILMPISLYSQKYSKVRQIPNGATITVPNDASNESRALLLLKNAGLITLKPSKATYTIADITTNPKNLKIKELDASQTAHSISDVAAAVVNTDYALAAKLSDRQAIFTEPINADSKQWVNFIAANKKDKHKAAYQAVVKAYQSQAVKQLLKKLYGNKVIAAWDLAFK